MSESLQQRIEKIRLWAKDPDRAASHVLVTILVVIILVVIALWIVWIVPKHEAAAILDPEKRLALEDELRKTITQIVLSIFGLVFLYFTWQRARVGDKTVQIMEQGHITDRYTKAIEQLGKLDGDKPNIEVRLGAIYALERIARDSPRDHWTIMEVLTAYVRQNAPVVTPDETPDPPPPRKLRTDIQAILTVLGRREIGRESSIQRIDLSSTHLPGAFLKEAKLQRADLSDANLQGAYLFKANLQNASLADANLQGTDLNKANLQGAPLFRANLQHAVLYNANLQGAPLLYANLQRASLGEANLQGADLHNANLQGARDLTPDQIRSAKFWKSATFSYDLREALGLPLDDSVEEAPQ